MGLTNNQQALFSFISATFLAVSVVSVPLGVSPYVTLTLGVIGSVGFAIKEALGDSDTVVIPSGTGSGSTTQIGTVSFNIAAAKAAGYLVYVNSSEPSGYVLFTAGTYYDVFGNQLGTTAPTGTGSQV